MDLKEYYVLTKPGIVYANAMTAAAGFLYASGGAVNWAGFLYMLVGISLIVASACVLNNVIDRNIDKKMARTKKRALVTGSIPVIDALLFGFILVAFGVVILYLTNFTALAVAMTGYISYLLLYGVAKRLSAYGTIIGTIPGAVPPVVGYTAVTGSVDITAAFLFLIMVFWQLPHFYAISIFRQKDYKSAGIPVWSVKKGIPSTKRQIILFTCLYIVVLATFFLLGYANIFFGLITLAVGLAWLYKAINGLRAKDNVKWALSVFGFSLIVLVTFSFSLAADAFIKKLMI